MTFSTDFSTDFELESTPEPAPEEDTPQEDGPWISHGVVHVAKPPNH